MGAIMNIALEDLMIPKVSGPSCRNRDGPEVIRLVVTADGYQQYSAKSFLDST
jgi:hypothetical protein